MDRSISASHGLFTRVVEGLFDLIKDLKAWYAHRKEVKQTMKALSALSNKELQDIGINRGDIWAIANGDTSFDRVRTENQNENLKGWV